MSFRKSLVLAAALGVARADNVPATNLPVREVIRQVASATPTSATNTPEKTFTAGAQTGRGMRTETGRYQYQTIVRLDKTPGISISH
jgi:hypothetical protein